MESFPADPLTTLADFFTSLAIGLLVGLERERNPTAKAGLRTFALVGLSGGLSQYLSAALHSVALVPVGLAAVAFAIVAAYYHHHEEWHDREPGTTTIVAVMACYLLGALALAGQRQLAVILAIAITGLLHFKHELSGAARRLDRRDLVSMLQFALVTFVVLPLLPDRGYGPDGLLNPRQVWLMVVLISGLSLAGYVALRLVGPDTGALVVGFLGGLVSSTATTLSFSRLARKTPDNVPMAATAIVTANLVLPLRLLVITFATAPAVAWTLAPALGAAILAGAASFWLPALRAPRTAHGAPPPRLSNPIGLPAALAFGALYAAVLLFLGWFGRGAGSWGTYGIAAVTGVTDMDAVTLSAGRMSAVGSISPQQAAIAVAVALTSNTAFKAAMMARIGGAAIFRRCLPAMASVAAVAVVAIALGAA